MFMCNTECAYTSSDDLSESKISLQYSYKYR